MCVRIIGVWGAAGRRRPRCMGLGHASVFECVFALLFTSLPVDTTKMLYTIWEISTFTFYSFSSPQRFKSSPTMVASFLVAKFEEQIYPLVQCTTSPPIRHSSTHSDSISCLRPCPRCAVSALHPKGAEKLGGKLRKIHRDWEAYTAFARHTRHTTDIYFLAQRGETTRSWWGSDG